MKMFRWSSATLVSLLIVGLSGTAMAKDNVGTVVAVRNKAVIERDKREIDARVRDPILLNDTVSTLEASRAKLLFMDDSVLTLGEKSRVIIKEFVYTGERGGRSVFNLIDGKMRSAVGRTEFEVHTPTAVAAARGTVLLFHIGITSDGKIFATIICTEGSSLITSTDPKNPGSTVLTAGMKITVVMGEPFPIPIPVSQREIADLLTDTDIGMSEIQIPGPVGVEIGTEGIKIDMPPVVQQPIVTPPPPPPPPPPEEPPPVIVPPGEPWYPSPGYGYP